MDKKPFNYPQWLRLGFSLAVLTALLVYLELFLPIIMNFNASLGETQAQVGYIAALRAQALLLWLITSLAMVSLFRQGVPVAPLAWVIQLVRIGLSHSGTWYMAGNTLFFVSPVLNFILMAMVPTVMAIIIWWSLAQFDGKRVNRIVDALFVPILWLASVVLVSAGNLFSWYWSGVFAIEAWPANLTLILFFVGVPLIVAGAFKRPLTALLLYWAGLALPVLLGGVLWGLYDGLALGLIVILPALGKLSVGLIWLELLLLFALPLVAILAIHQGRRWRRGEKLLEIW